MREETIRAGLIVGLTGLSLVGIVALAWAPDGQGAAERLEGALVVLIPACIDATIYAARTRRKDPTP